MKLDRKMEELLNKINDENFGEKMKKEFNALRIFKVKVTLIDNKEKIEIVSAEDELSAIDLVMKQYNTKEILDIKII